MSHIYTMIGVQKKDLARAGIIVGVYGINDAQIGHRRFLVIETLSCDSNTIDDFVNESMFASNKGVRAGVNQQITSIFHFKWS